MPVVKDRFTPPNVSRFSALRERLVSEWRQPGAFGQPLIREETFDRTGLIGLTVVWDEWEPRDDLERGTIITNAYSEVFGSDQKDRIAFAVGFTEPEAVESGVLPFEVMPLVRKSDPPEWFAGCRQAMLDLGASELWKKGYPRLRLPTLELAEQYVRELSARVPGSDDVWSISQAATAE